MFGGQSRLLDRFRRARLRSAKRTQQQKWHEHFKGCVDCYVCFSA